MPVISPARPALMVLFNPVLNTRPNGFRGARVLGDQAIDISPSHHIDADVPAMLVFLGDADSIVPVSDAADFHHQMTEEGLECEIALYANEPHGCLAIPDPQ